MYNNTQDQSSSGIEFIPAKCPNCGGELRIPNNREVIKCMYCGYDIVIQKNQQFVDKGKNVERLLTLADASEEAGNVEEGYKYYSQVLEIDIDVPNAWLGKGRCAGWLSTVQSPRIDEALACIKRGLAADRSQLEYTAKTLARITSVYTVSVIKYISEELDEKIKPRGTVVDPVMSGIFIGARRSEAEKQLNKEFKQVYQPILIKGLQSAWNIHQEADIALNIYKAINAVKGSYVLNADTKTGFENNLQPVINEIRTKLPTFVPPQPKKDCFVATATMGDYDHPYVIDLRRFRDQVLNKFIVGRLFIHSYYRFGPYPASCIKKSNILRVISVNFIIKPSVLLANIIYSIRLLMRS